jgi:inner membrane protein
MNSQPSFFERYAAIIKMVTIGILTLLLLIPSMLVLNLIDERESTQYEVKREISEKWGLAQTITGPIVTVPYTIRTVDNNKIVRTEKRHIHLLPEQLDIAGSLDTSLLKRSIYEVVSYTSKLQFSGNFTTKEIDKLAIDKESIQWENASVYLGITDLTGVQEEIVMNWGNDTVNFNPGIDVRDMVHTGVNTPINLAKGDDKSFSFDLALKGSDHIHFIPVGKETNVKLSSTCPNPNFPQVWTNASQNIASSWFGVELMMEIDHYQKTTRSAKYAILFISMTFLTFFFIEILNKKKIHFIQYILIGLVLVVFYVLLLSLSEQFGFDTAYFISALAVVCLITVYTASVLASKQKTGIMATILIVLYAFIYIIIQMSEYSLLFGSIGLFLFLAAVMLISRKVNWYTIGIKDSNEVLKD